MENKNTIPYWKSLPAQSIPNYFLLRSRLSFREKINPRNYLVYGNQTQMDSARKSNNTVEFYLSLFDERRTRLEILLPYPEENERIFEELMQPSKKIIVAGITSGVENLPLLNYISIHNLENNQITEEVLKI